ncbi:Transcriptional regulator, LacI family [Marinobacterium lacunae]|uniref:Transcriptional regulator, LacI family n=1 Tax=Marinobacterium lacunae TaxID=1232683 RepID=A0A081G4I3_9GAMM|nr:LacI family DNA-binding transcriptional regulator [Marinobacterium lacunae]KEA65688.1 Transcriptional regulator, LacI family [Marinobacterium lacunae]
MSESKNKFNKDMPSARRNQASGATLIDVAKVAGVSPITVSRALNRPDQVSEKAREKVRRAVEQVGYIPNMLAGGLASRQSKLVAIFVPTIAHPIFAEMVQALMDELSRAGYQAILGLTGYQKETEETLFNTILGRRPDGIVLTGTQHSELMRRRLIASGIPVVEAWDLCDDPIDMLVGFSHEQVGREVARHLYAKGYRRFAVVTAEDARGMRRYHALLDELHHLGIDDVPTAFIPPPSSLNAGREKVCELLDAGHRPEVVVCSSDTVAQGVLAEAASRGWTVPKDLAVMGFGELSNASQVYPSLSSVRLDGDRVGGQIAQALLERFKNPDAEIAPLRIDTGFTIVDREST